jgi:hypothetical protein
MRRRFTSFVLLCLLADCTRESTFDAVVLRRVIRRGDSPAADAGFEYLGGTIRIVDDGRKRVTFDLDAKTVTFVNKEEKTYDVRTLDEVKRKFEAQRKARDPSINIVLEKTDTTERIAGQDARRYTLTTNRARGAVWLSTDVRRSPAWREWETVIAYLGGAFALGVEVTEAVSQLDGYPLRATLTFPGGNGGWTITTEVAEIAKPAAADTLSIPDGFQRADDFQLPDSP